ATSSAPSMPSTAKVDAIVLAGGELERPRFPSLPPEIARKAEIVIQGRPLVHWTLIALRSVPCVGRVLLVGPVGLTGCDELADEILPDTGTITGNLRAGLDSLIGNWEMDIEHSRVLVLSGDLPLLTPAAIEDLLNHSPDADLVFPILERSDTHAAFPNREWLFAKTADGSFTGCSAAVI